ncbi:MAG: hypothetical protein R3F24_14780 [Gammaproteobacteria bacterium]
MANERNEHCPELNKALPEKNVMVLSSSADDGVNWLASSGTADAARVYIVGWCYGSYAAQLASFRNLETCRCAG